MDDKLIRFLEKIEFDEDKYNFFSGVKIKSVIVNEKEKKWIINLKMEEIIPVEIYDLLVYKSKSINEVDSVEFKLLVDNISKFEEYFMYIFNKISLDKVSVASLLKNEIVVSDSAIEIEVINPAEESKFLSIKPEIEGFLYSVGFSDFKLNSRLNESKREEVKELMKTPEVIVETEKSDEGLVIGNEIKGKATSIKDIIAEENNVVVEVFLFDDPEFRPTKNDGNIITLKISDKTDSIIAKMFTKDKDVVSKLSKNLSAGNWYKIRGYVKHDDYLRDLVLNIRDVERIKSKDVVRVDNAEKKRIELHLHTKMSAMDGLIDFGKPLFKFLKNMEHNTVAVTDKNTVQEFTKMYKEKGDIKVLFGSELFVVDDEVGVVVRGTDYSLDDTFVVFDFETTGLNAGAGDSIIEIGAVKIKDGEIIDRFSELVDPGVKLKPIITNITKITDAMLKGKDNEENAFKRFKEWYGDLPMVAHNARFDCSFIDMCYAKYNLGTFENPVLDTMELSKVLNPDASRHSLSACVKRYNVEFDEGGHHRADYDAEGTAYVLNKMFKGLDSSYKTINDLDRLIDKDTIHKLGRPFHLTVYAKNDVGLKNLFKIISLANTKYLYKTPRILKSELTKRREGLIIGSGCLNGEVWNKSKTATEDELMKIMDYYDFIEVNPPSIACHLIDTGEFANYFEIKENIKKIINCADRMEKIVCAAGDVHTLNPEDNIYRNIIVYQKIPGGGFHQLYRSNIKNIPNAYFMTTEEMLKEFDFLSKEKAMEVVVDNTHVIADMVGDVHVLNPGLCAPKMENSAGKTRDMVYGNAKAIYGENLPSLITERIEKELGGIIGGNYDVIYLISQMLVKKSMDDGYIVGSRGSVGSSLVATFMDITEVNPLPPHYVCPSCKKYIFEENDKSLSDDYGSGFDLPDRYCECGEKFNKQGQDIPFETFLGFNADKVPDIDLNFSGEYQAKAHNYTKELFGEEKVYRAGTVSTVASKTAFGFVKGYLENSGIRLRNIEVERLSKGITGVKRTTGQHPGGIVVIGEGKDVFDFTPYQYPAENTSSAWYTTHFEYHDIEENLLKLDILGHDDPTVLKYLGDAMEVNINDIPLDDPQVLSLFSSPEALGVTKEEISCETGTIGIPEFGTNFVIRMLAETRPKSVAEIIKISGLSHGTDVWNGNARDLILNGVVEFKEVIGCRDDIMNSLIKYGVEKGIAFKMSEFIRKGKSVKDPDTWSKYADIMKESNVPDWFIDSCSKIKYMFPKAHASAYVTMALRVAWFKVHHPLTYYKVYLSIRRSDFDLESMVRGKDAIKERIADINNKGFSATNKEIATVDSLRSALEMIARGFRFDPINLEKSDATMFTITEDGKGLIPPFIALEGMGETAAKKLVEERELKPFVSIEDVQFRGKVSQTLIETLTNMGVFEGMPESSQLSLF